MTRLGADDLVVRPWPLLVWLALNLLTLTLPVFQIPLSENVIRPVERRAIDEVAILQIAGSSLLIPFLFQNLGTSAALAAASWPFVLLAGFLSATANAQIFACTVYLSAWLTILALGNFVCSCSRARLAFTALASLASIGGASLWYIHAEFASTQPLSSHGVGPILDVLTILHDPQAANRPWWVLIGVLTILSLASILVLLRRSNSPATDVAAAPLGR